MSEQIPLWLVSQITEEAVTAERERIIKLLETEQNAANEQTVIRNVLNGAIALIKGENK